MYGDIIDVSVFGFFFVRELQTSIQKFEIEKNGQGGCCSIPRILDAAEPIGTKAGPGHWNDLDMLEVGNGGMTFDEYGTA